jgi:DnaJ-class molecular chaperone
MSLNKYDEYYVIRVEICRLCAGKGEVNDLKYLREYTEEHGGMPRHIPQATCPNCDGKKKIRMEVNIEIVFTQLLSEILNERMLFVIE